MTEPLLQAYRAMLKINIRATGRLHQQMQSNAYIINNNIKLGSTTTTTTTTINTLYANEVREPNIQKAPSPFNTIDRIYKNRTQ
jgi:hypothetical protein